MITKKPLTVPAKTLSPYPVNNKIALPNLHLEGADDRLVYRTKTEEAVVLIADDKIQKVLHKDLVNHQESVIEPDAAHHIVVGKDNWARDVYHFLKPNPLPHLQLRLGLTVHQGDGTWSSLPHPFENHPEPGFEEAFFYLLTGETRRAFQVGRGMWPDGSKADAVWPVLDRTFSVIPMGYHPVVGEPGCRVRYVWAYLAKKKLWEKI